MSVCMSVVDLFSTQSMYRCSVVGLYVCVLSVSYKREPYKMVELIEVRIGCGSKEP